MTKKKKRYPFSVLMLLSVFIFWGALAVMGYQLKLDGSLVKIEEPDYETVTTDKDNLDYEADSDGEDGFHNEAVFEHGSNDKTVSENDAAVSENDVTVSENDVTMSENNLPGTSQFTQVGMEYLDGALFIGDSRTAVLYEYANWEKTEFFVEYGLTVWGVMDAKLATDAATGKKITVREALSRQQYDKIYLMLGVNELGQGTAETFYKQYKKVVEEIRTLQPDAIIFIQSILHVSDEKDKKGTYINNEAIGERNEKIKTLADNQGIFWIDENEVFDDEKTGKLNPEYSWDGVHIKAKFIPIWTDFLLKHGIISP